ncbi:MAG: peptidylprolyl isomerase [Dehalococcoidia bacterium]|nr:peptidylprolyl isomerase [Dehalococcoidia bacterium]
MPRQRRRRRGPAQYEGPRKAKPPFPINLLFNVKLFYVTFIVVMIASMAAVGLGSGFGSSNRSNLPPIDDTQSTPEPTPASAVFADGPARTIDGTRPYIATLETNKGKIKIQLATDAPSAVNSFAFLAGKGFYDGTAFFYVNKGLGAVAGDPTCSTGGQAACSGLGGPGYSLPLEAGGEKHDQWAVAAPPLSEGGQEVHGSQFRILLAADARLDGKETIFGKVIAGQDILGALPDYCAIVNGEMNGQQCDPSLVSQLVIEKVVVQPA